MLTPAAPSEEFFAPGMFIGFAVLGIGAAVVMFFMQRNEPIGRWRRTWSNRIMIPVLFLLCCGLLGVISVQVVMTEKSDAALMAEEIARVYDIDVSSTEAAKLLDGDTVLIDDTAYRLEDDRLVEAAEWKATDVAQ